MKHYSSHEAASLLRTSAFVVERWLADGLLQSKPGADGQPRIPYQALLDLITQRQGLLPSTRPSVKRSVLIVDDLEQIRNLLVRLIRTCCPSWTCYTARDGFDAVLTALTRHCDLVLLDRYLPGLDGPGVCRTLRELPAGQAMRILLMSGALNEELQTLGREAGADQAIEKPTSTAALEPFLW